MTAVPFVTPSTAIYPNIPFYYTVTGTETGSCPVSFTDHFQDIRCVDNTGNYSDKGPFDCNTAGGEGKINCGATQCADVDDSWCNLKVPFTIYNDDAWAANCMWNDTSGACEDIEAVKLTRPTAFDRPDDSVHRWYVGDASYAWALNYTCDEDLDELGSDDDHYMNIFCESTTPELGFSTYPVFCHDKTFGRVNTQMIGTNIPNCSALTCEDMDGYVCVHPVDLFTVEDDGVKYQGTCTQDTGDATKCVTSATTGGPAPTFNNISRPKAQADGTTSKYWFVFNEDYNGSVKYTCSPDDNPTSNDYINVLCDNGFAGSVDTDVTVECVAAQPQAIKDASIAKFDCSMDSCKSFDKAMCKEDFDLFDGTGDDVAYKMTCTVSDDSSVTTCVNKDGSDSGVKGVALVSFATMIVGLLL